MTNYFWFRWILVVLYGGSMGIVFVYNLNKMHSWSFLFHPILSLYHVVPWSASFSHRAGIKVHFVDHYFIKRYLVTNFSNTCTRSSLDVNPFVECPLFYQWTESLLLINGKSRIYLFINLYLFVFSIIKPFCT